jgi:hypothetical protein
VLRIFIALKNPTLSAGFEPANLSSNGKHDNHYIPDNDSLLPYFFSLSSGVERE